MATSAKQSGFLIQSSHGNQGNFELVVPRGAGGLSHYWRDNDAAGVPWRVPTAFGNGNVHGASLIQSSFGPGNLEVVAVEGNRLAAYWRDVSNFEWSTPSHFGGQVQGTPALIQSSYGSPGNFEVVVPRAGGGLSHYWRDNSTEDFVWSGAADFGSGNVTGVGLIQSSFGPGNLEVVAVEGSRLAAYWRDASSFEWSAPSHFGGQVQGAPALIQSSYGSPGNFEVVVPRAGGGLSHYWRNNSVQDFPWSDPTDFGSGDSVTAVSLIQSNFGPGNLEVVAIEGDRLVHYWRNDSVDFGWSGPYYIPNECVFVHTKVLVAPNVAVDDMLASMRAVYGPSGFMVEHASTEGLSLPTLEDCDVGTCVRGSTTAEQDDLFSNRNDVGENDVTVYFVRSTNPPSNGCAAHPDGRPGAVVARGATQWTMAHEVGHVLGLNHVDDNDRLMTGNGTSNITNPPPDLVDSEIATMRNSASTERV